jgi:hypothetical protein
VKGRNGEKAEALLLTTSIAQKQLITDNGPVFPNAFATISRMLPNRHPIAFQGLPDFVCHFTYLRYISHL